MKMKTIRIFTLAALASFIVVSCDDNKKKDSDSDAKSEQTAVDPTSKTEEEPTNKIEDEFLHHVEINTSVDSVSYLLGVNYGMMLSQNNFFDEIDDCNMEAFKKGMADALGAGQPKDGGPNPYQPLPDSEWAEKFRISPYDMNDIINNYLLARHEAVAERNRLEGQMFLNKNAAKRGVQVTESGLQYVIHQEGEGDLIKPEDIVVVNYKGTLIDGTEFDANDSTEFAVNRVIPGWTEGLTLMNKGTKATLFVPGDLAYGQNPPRGSVIEPNSVLLFEVEILDVKRQ